MAITLEREREREREEKAVKKMCRSCTNKSTTFDFLTLYPPPHCILSLYHLLFHTKTKKKTKTSSLSLSLTHTQIHTQKQTLQPEPKASRYTHTQRGSKYRPFRERERLC